MSSVGYKLRRNADRFEERVAFTFLHDSGAVQATRSYGDLVARAERIGATLRSAAPKGTPILLLYPPGLDFIDAFYGCIFSGLVAVPTYPPDPAQLDKTLPRLRAVIRASGASVVATLSGVRPWIEQLARVHDWVKELRVVATDEVEKQKTCFIEHDSSDLAFLQYTSGSTAAPRGTMVSHGNLLHNTALIQRVWPMMEGEVVACWLPPYHDMGLIGCLIYPPQYGLSVVLMSPGAFLKNPMIWLEAITRYGAVISPAPNFAYDLCVRKITSEQRAGLDLHSWRYALNGAEPVQSETLERFTRVFAPYGFNPNAFCPCYGLAEVTLLAVGDGGKSSTLTVDVDAESLSRGTIVTGDIKTGKTRRLVSCGRPKQDVTVAIVDPGNRQACAEGGIGEVWVASDSVARGYWHDPLSSEATFDAHLAGHSESGFLRTGDLGFLHQGELFIVGRLKDLIVVRGMNHHPQDLERTVEKSAPGLRPGCGAAFAIEGPGNERVVVVQEVDRRYRERRTERSTDPAPQRRSGEDRRTEQLDAPGAPFERAELESDRVIRAIRADVSHKHGLQLAAVVLVKPGTIPKTGSGKIRRSATRAAFQNGSLNPIATWSLGPRPALERGEGAASKPKGDFNERFNQISVWLFDALSTRLGVARNELDLDVPFVDLGLGSAAAIELAGELERLLGCWLNSTVLWDYPSIRKLTTFLARPSVGGPRRESDEPSPVQVAPNIETRTIPADVPGRVKSDDEDSIAIVAIGCRYPGADTAEEFWQLLRAGDSAITEVPVERWNIAQVFDPDPGAPGKMVTRWGGFLRQVDQFDPAYFAISPREAAAMDPQQRLLLEVTYEAIENGGLVLDDRTKAASGVFIGISSYDYSKLALRNPRSIGPYTGTGNSHSVAANRISYLLDLRGPSVAVDTACSSSLYAIHLACRSILSGETVLAFAGGVNLILTPDITISLSKAGVLSPDGRCRPFAADANGYVRGEGAGVVVLKRLSRALEDGDTVYAVIRGTAANNDGRSNGLMAPNGAAQEAVIREAYRNARVDPGRVDYVETHGTGTVIGDPIEAAALGAVLARQRPVDRPCAIGSVKANIGHLEAAAGIAGLTKVALALYHREMPKSVNFEQPNPHISFDRLQLRVQQTTAPWPAASKPALAGVSAFGFGGTNVHVVLAAPSEPVLPGQREEKREGPYILPISARSRSSLDLVSTRYGELMKEMGEGPLLPSVCAAASRRREHNRHRLAVVASSAQGFVGAFASDRNNVSPAGLYRSPLPPGGQRKIVFVFPGQGQQRPGMGRILFNREPVFRAAVCRCDDFLRERAQWSLLGELAADGAQHRLNQTQITQPALVVLQIALAELWRSWGVEPDAVVGHSMGEIAAAFVAGALTLEDALDVAIQRGRVMQRVEGKGAMAVVALSLDEARAALEAFDGQLSVAASNSTTSTVISGEPGALREFVATLEAGHVFCRILGVSLAGHSQQMDGLLDDFGDAVAGISGRPQGVPIVSTVAGAPIEGTALGRDYWLRNLRDPVLFAPAVRWLANDGYDLYVEISAHPTLGIAIQQELELLGRQGEFVPCLQRDRDEYETMLSALGQLYTAGQRIDWENVYPGHCPNVPLPPNPWQRERHWVDESATPDPHGSGLYEVTGERRALAGSRVQPATSGADTFWETLVSLDRYPFLRDHNVGGAVVFPATAYIEMALTGAADALGAGACRLADVEIQTALFLPDVGERVLQTVIHRLPADVSKVSFRIFSRSAAQRHGAWTEHVRGAASLEVSSVNPADGELDLASIQSRCDRVIMGTELYERLAKRRLYYGSTFRGVDEVWCGKGEALGRIRVIDPCFTGSASCFVHPALFDACLQVVGATNSRVASTTYLPVGAGSIWVSRWSGGQFWSHAVMSDPLDAGGDGPLKADVRVFDERGQMVAEVKDFVLAPIEHTRASESGDLWSDWTYGLEWRKKTNVREGGTHGGRATWLFFTDEPSIADDICAVLGARGDECIRVLPGASLRMLGSDQWNINTDVAENYIDLLSQVAVPGKEIRIVYLCSFADGGAIRSIDTLRSSLRRVCCDVMHIVKALLREAIGARLWIVTRGAQAVGSEINEPGLSQAAVWGLGRTLAVEHRDLWGGLIDLDPRIDERGISRAIIQAIIGADNDDQVALRGGHTYVPRLVKLPPETSAPPLICDSNATYLVTGGLGGLGLETARWLVARGARNLALLSRSRPRARRLQGDIGPDTREARRSEILDELEAAGAQVRTIAADVTDPASMAKALASLHAELPPLRGIIHAAGVVTTIPFCEMDWPRFREVLEAKTVGTWVLHELTKFMALQFFVSFSSGASVWGSKLLAHYAAANAFLDAFAHYRRSLGLPATTINWGMLAETGMTAVEETAGALLALGFRPMRPQSALLALESAMAREVMQEIVTSTDWTVFRRVYEAFGSRPMLEEVASGRGESPTSNPAQRRAKTELLGLAVEERSSRIAAVLHEHAARLLGMLPSDLDPDSALADRGFDSMMATELRATVETTIGLHLSVIDILRGHSLTQLAAALYRQLGDDARSSTAEPGELGRPPATDRSVMMDQDRVLDPSVNPSGAIPFDAAARAPVFVTGGTGFLGAHVISELVARGFSPVYCLVRADDREQGAGRLRRALASQGLPVDKTVEQLVTVCGDIGKERFGLTRREYDALADEVRQIVHAGYLVNFLFSYSDMRGPNVIGTKEILKFAAGKRVKALHFISTFSVFCGSDYEGLDAREADRPRGGRAGYQQAKAVSEALVDQAQLRGVPASIYRPPFIGWHSETGAYNNNDFLVKLILSCIELGHAPGIDATFHVRPVDSVSRLIAEGLADGHNLGKTYHLIGSQDAIRWRDLVLMLDAVAGPIRLVPYPEWWALVLRAAKQIALSSLVPGGGSPSDAILDILSTFETRRLPARFDASNTQGIAVDDALSSAITVESLRAFLDRAAPSRLGS